MNHDTIWSPGARSRTFQERSVLDVLGHNLRKVYGEPKRDALPANLSELIARLERAERKAVHASDR
jgi:hypothetical protein